MIFKNGDKVKIFLDDSVVEGTVIGGNRNKGTVLVSSDSNGVIEAEADKVSPNYQAIRTEFDQEGALPDYEEHDYYDEHYAKMPLQPIVLMQMSMTPAEFKGFLRGNIIKYTMRSGHKKGESREKDIAKAERYREWLLQVEAGLMIDPRD